MLEIPNVIKGILILLFIFVPIEKILAIVIILRVILLVMGQLIY
jgi:hypothetical protein